MKRLFILLLPPHHPTPFKPIWITLTLSREANPRPMLHSLYSIGCLYRTVSYIFQYPEANPIDQFFMSMSCLNFPQNSPDSCREKSELEYTINQLNAASDFQCAIFYSLLRDKIINPSNVDDKNSLYKSSPSSSDSSTGNLDHIVRCINGSIYGILLVGAWLWNFISLIIVSIVSTNFPLLGVNLLYLHLIQRIRTASLKDISFISLYAFKKFSASIDLLMKLNKFVNAWSYPKPQRLQLFREIISTVVFIWVDLILGLAMSLFLFQHSDTLIKYTQSQYDWFSQAFLIQAVQSIKLESYGIKFNHSLTRMMEKLLGFLIRKFAIIVKFVEFLHFPVIRLVAFFGTLGITSQLMLLIDIFRLVTVHIAIIQRLFYFLHYLVSDIILSLWLLFRGKKSNILRGRIDNCNYDRNQLLFGTVLFSILLFLYPTFAAYYFLFTAIHICIGLVQLFVWLIASAVTEFPYFLLLLRIFSPSSVSQGVQFSFLWQESPVSSPDTISSSSSSGGSRSGSIYPQQSDAAPHPHDKLTVDMGASYWQSRRSERRQKWRHPTTPTSNANSSSNPPNPSNPSNPSFNSILPSSDGKLFIKIPSSRDEPNYDPNNVSPVSPYSQSTTKILLAYDKSGVSSYNDTTSCNHENASSSSYTTIYFSVASTAITLWNLFSGYRKYLFHMSQKKELLLLIRGLVLFLNLN